MTSRLTTKHWTNTMDSTMSVYYLNRGIFHSDFASYMDACRDFEKAARMGEAEAKTVFEENNCDRGTRRKC